MKIDNVETVILKAGPRRTWLFVEVSTDEGLIGVGEGSQSRHDEAVAAEVERIKPLYVGRDPMNLIELRNRLRQRPDVSRHVHCAVSALEQALWDLIGQALDQPVYRLIGGAVRSGIAVYANVTFAANSASPNDLAVAARDAVGTGYRAVKINAMAPDPGGGQASSTFEISAQMDLAQARIREVRAAIGPDIRLLTDWSLVLPPAEASRALDICRESDVHWIEEPHVSGNAERLRELRKRAPMRIAAGEQLSSRWDFKTLIEALAVDVIMPDVKWAGGILEVKKIAAMAETSEIEVSPHNMSGPVGTAANRHICSTLANFHLLEMCFGSEPLYAEIAGPVAKVSNGELPLPELPGLGIRWNKAAARANS